jgi:hypothetical protein
MICAKTGRPTAVSVAIQVVDRPTWTAVLLPVTVVGWLIARWFAATFGRGPYRRSYPAFTSRESH